MAKYTPPQQCTVDYPHIAHTDYMELPHGGRGLRRCPGLNIKHVHKLPPKTRANVVVVLRAVKERCGYLVRGWNVTGTRWRSDTAQTLPRRPEEWPHNRIASWGELMADCDAMITMLEELRTYARARRDNLVDSHNRALASTITADRGTDN